MNVPGDRGEGSSASGREDPQKLKFTEISSRKAETDTEIMVLCVEADNFFRAAELDFRYDQREGVTPDG